eukprot:m.161015 g.161015  ORF g.161015 m.161015 type:complete len:2636 (+) comp15183_c0_seq1:24-7931(+)
MDDEDEAPGAAEEILHYGDFVSLFANEVKGFLSNNTSSSTHNNLRAVSGANTTDPKVKEFQECVFQIFAPNKYKARRRLNKYLAQLMEKKNKDGEKLTKDEILMSSGSYPELVALQDAAAVEEEDNKLEQQRRHGDELSYGQGMQLLHVHSGRFLHISSTATSKLEPSNMRVVLDETDARAAWLKISPRFKVRADGDPIRNQDQVKVESLESGQFLHSSVDAQKKLGAPASAAKDVHEINASVQASSFTVRLYKQFKEIKEDDEEQKAVIDGGDIIQLYHKETGSYMAAEGSFTEEESLSALVENVHLRIRAPDPSRPSRNEHPTSAVSFWIVENENVTSGQSVKWQNRVRFKHVTTQLYLALEIEPHDDGELPNGTGSISRSATGTLTKPPPGLKSIQNSEGFRYSAKLVAVPDSSTLFKLHRVILEDEEAVIDDTYTRVQHAETGAWLSAQADRKYIRNVDINPHAEKDGRPGLPAEFNPLINAVQKVVWDKAELINLSFSPRPQFDDAFIINRVTSEKVSNVNFVKGTLPVLRQYLIDRVKKNQSVDLQYAGRMVSMLKELKEFMYYRGQSQKRRQKLLRDFKVTELVVDMLRYNFNRFNPQSGVDLRTLNQNTQINQIVRMVCDAAADVLDAYLDGDSRKNELYMARHLPYFQYLFGSEIKMEKMYTELVKDNLELVECIGDREVKRVIQLIGQDKNPDFLAFLAVLCECDDNAIPEYQNKVAKLLLEDSKNLVYLTEVNEDKNGVVVSSDGGRSWQPMESFASSGRDERRATREYLFLEKQLDLFGQLCLGRNSYCIELITDKLKYLTWEECFLCTSSKALPKILRAKYVELIRNLFVDVGKNVDVLADIRLDYSWSSLSPEPYADAVSDRTQSLSGAFLPIFPTLSKWISNQLRENPSLVAQDKPNNALLYEILELLWMLIRFGYYVAADDIHKMVQPLTSLLDGFNDLETHASGGPKSVGFNLGASFVSKHKPVKMDSVEKWQTERRYESNDANSLVMDVKSMALNCINSVFNLITTIRIQLLMWDFKGVTSWGASRQSMHMKNKPTRNSAHITNLLKSLEAHNSDEFDELFPHCHTSREYVRSIVAKSNFITPNWFVQDGCRSADGANKNLIEVLLDLGRYQSQRLLLASFELFQRIYTATDNMFHYAVDAQVLIHEESIQLAKYLQREMPPFRRVSRRPLVEDDINHLVKVFQKLIRDCSLRGEPGTPHGMNQSIIKNSRIHLVVLDMLGRRDDLTPELLGCMFSLLKNLANGNPSIQSLLFHHLDVILKTKGEASGWENEMGLCVAEIFNASRETCLNVSEHHVEEMVEIVARLQKQVPGMLEALTAIVKLEDVNIPLKRNQDIIIKSLMKHRQEVIAVAFIDDQSSPAVNAKRTDLLRGDGSKNDKTDRALLKYHLALVSLLASCAEGENEFIESVLQTVFTVSELVETLSDPQILPDRKSAYMRFLLWVYLNTGAGPSIENGTIHLKTEDKFFSSLETIAQQKLGVLAKQAGPCSKEDLSFAFDAYIPILSVVVKTFFAPSEFPTSASRMERVTRILMDFCRKVVPKVFNRVWIKAMCATFVNIQNRLPNAVNQKFMGLIVSKLTSADADIMQSPAEVAYNKAYHDELELNAKFNRFVTNLEIVYHGKNDVETQLHQYRRIRNLSSHDREDEYCEGPEEDEHLPLGEYFQSFISVFLDVPRNGAPTIHVDDIKTVVNQFIASQSLGSTLTPEGLDRQHAVNATLLQVLRAILHNVKILFGEEDEETFVALQDEMAATGLILPTTDFMNSNSEDVAREAVALLCAVLDGGNKVAQGQLEKYFLHTREETFFQDVTDRLTLAKNSMLQNRVLKRQLAEEEERSKSVAGTLTLAAKAHIDQSALQDDTPQHSKKESKESIQISVKDEGNIELTFRLLQLMCEGHNVVIKDYLREQRDNMRSLDLVGETVKFLDLAIQEIDVDNMALLIQSFETLVEFSQGIAKNQAAIFDAHCMDSVNKVLRTRDFPEDISLGVQYKLKQAAAQLILAMLEDNTEDTKNMASELEDTLDIKEVLNTLDYFWSESNDSAKRAIIENDEDEEPPTAMEVGYDWYCVLARLTDFTNVKYSTLPKYISEEEDQKKKSAFDMFEKEDCTIEIVRGGNLVKVHFPGARWKPFLRAEVKETLQWKVDRSSPSDKIRSFVEESRTIIADILYEKEQVHSSAVAGFLIRGHSRWRNSLLFITFIINILIISSWSAKLDYNDPVPNTFSGYDGALYILGGCHLLATLLVAASHWIVTPPSFIPVIQSIPFLPETLGTLGLYSEPAGHAADRTRVSAFSFDSIYYTALIVFSVLGLFTSGYLYSLHLLHIVSGNDTLQRVVQAVTKNGRSLLWVALLMIIVIYQYSLWAFAFYRRSFEPTEGAYCQTEFQCFITSLRLGMMSGGGLGEAIPTPDIYGFHTPGLRTIFDLSFFIIITTIGMNVVFGIIVDTFSELRDEKYAVEEAMKSECFVCSLKAYEFEKGGVGFENHIKNEHNIWSYVFYMLHLDDKDPTEYNSNENYVSEKLEDDQYDFFPINRALSLSASGDGPDFQQTVIDMLEKLTTRMDRQEQKYEADKLEREERRQEQLARLQPQRARVPTAPSQTRPDALPSHLGEGEGATTDDDFDF